MIECRSVWDRGIRPQNIWTKGLSWMPPPNIWGVIAVTYRVLSSIQHFLDIFLIFRRFTFNNEIKLNCVNCTKCGQWILKKSIIIVHTGRHILRLNSPNSISAEALPQNPLGDLTALPRPLSWILENLILRRGRGKEGRERAKGEGRIYHCMLPTLQRDRRLYHWR